MTTKIPHASMGALCIVCNTMLALISVNPQIAEKKSLTTEDTPVTRDAEFGKPVHELRMKLQFDGKASESSAKHCLVVIENVGETSLNVNLGVMLGNGKSHHPTSLLLVVREGKDATRLSYGEPRVAGRLDPFVVSLPKGSSYILRCPLDDFVRADGGGRFDFTANNYEVEAELVGQPVTETSPDLSGLKLMHFWQGMVHSNVAKTLHILK